jgi:hypothetical protein
MQHLRWRQPMWAAPWVLTLSWAGAIVYGSLLPWQFDVAGFVAGHEGPAGAVWAWLSSPTWRGLDGRLSSLGVPAWQSDLVLNLGLYVPLGLLVRWALMRGGRAVWQQIAVGLLIVAGLSWLLECTQALMPGRYPSLNDFLANVLPASTAVMLAPLVRQGFKAAVATAWRPVRPGVRGAYRRLRQRPALDGLALIAAAVALLLAWPSSLGGEISGLRLAGLPFAGHFARSYDVAAWQLAHLAAAYVLLTLLVVMFLGRARLAWVAPVIGGLMVLAELVGALAMGGAVDLTEPLLALFVAAAVVTAVSWAGRVVTQASRRQAPLPTDLV